MNRSLVILAPALAAIVLVGCSSGSKPGAAATEPGASPTEPGATASATPTPAVTRTIANCPVDREICDFALQAETFVRQGEARSLIAPGTAWDNANDIGIVRSSIEGSLPLVARLPRLASIGCPLQNGAGDCSAAFSLTFTTINTVHEHSERGFLTLMFSRRPRAMPALNGVAVPDGDDRWRATEGGGTSAGCGLSGLVPKTESECIRTVFTIVGIGSPVLAGSPPECPLLPALCDFALRTESSLAAKDFAAIGGMEMQAALAESVSRVLGSGAPRLVSIGCPYGPTQLWCTGPFALAFTTLDPASDWTTSGGVLLLLFEQDAKPPRLAQITPVTNANSRQAMLFGGIAVEPCDLAGRSPATPPGAGPCSSQAQFEPYWSSKPFPPQQVVAGTVLKPGLPEPPPPGTALYVVTGCGGCDGPDESLQQHAVDASGMLSTTTLLENGKGPLTGWTIGEIMATADGRLFAAKVCDYQYCGGMGNEVPTATHRVIWSTDGGETWTEAWRGQVVRASILSMTSTGLIVRYIDGTPGAYAEHYLVVVPSGTRELKRPAQLDFRASPLLFEDGAVIWIPLSTNGLLVGSFLAEDGTPLPLKLPAGASGVRGGSLPSGRLWLSWSQSAPAGAWLGVFDLAGTMLSSYRPDGILRMNLANESTGVGNLATQGMPSPSSSLPLLLDLSPSARRFTWLAVPSASRR